jgi:NAD(P)H-hydrate epimerase
LIVAGSVNYTGAALLSGKAAYLAGAGLVTMGVPIPVHSALAGQFPEGTWLLLTHKMGVIAERAAEIVLENLGNASALLIGPGFGLDDSTKHFMEKLFSNSPKGKQTRIGFIPSQNQEQRAEKPKLPPLVIDADGLKLLSKLENWAQLLTGTAVLTPHPGEMAVMTGLDVNKIQEERVAVAEEHAASWGHVIVLKGANTVVAEPGGRTALIPVASPALARAGTGDVLAGLITGLRAQGMEAFESALCGAWVHAQSGLQAASRLGTNRSVLAGDLLDALPVVFRQLEK